MLAASPHGRPWSKRHDASRIGELGGVQLHVRFGEREGEALVLADRSAEHDALVGVVDRLGHRGPADAERLGGDQDPLGVQAVEQVPESLALLPDPPAHRHAQPVVAHLARHDGVAAELGDRA